MKKWFLSAATVLLSLNLNTAQAIGGEHSTGSSCVKPIFSQIQPALNKYLQSFSEFSFVTTENTSPTSIVVTVTFGESDIKYIFTSKELSIKALKNGHLIVKGKIDRPMEHGFVRLSMSAHSKPGCEHTEGYLLRVY
jgi:hypothetical protein